MKYLLEKKVRRKVKHQLLKDAEDDAMEHLRHVRRKRKKHNISDEDYHNAIYTHAKAEAKLKGFENWWIYGNRWGVLLLLLVLSSVVVVGVVLGPT